MILFFHKNIIYSLPQFFFGFVNGYSGQTLWEPWYLTMYNALITCLAVGGYGVWDQDLIFNNKKENKLINVSLPYLYKYTRDVEAFTLKKFIIWLVGSCLHSLVVFGLPFLAYYNLILKEGYDLDFYS